MKRKQWIILAVVVMATAIFLKGCTADVSVLQKARDATATSLEALKQELPKAQANLDATPPGPGKDKAQAVVDALEKQIANAEAVISGADKVIQAVKSGDSGNFGAAVTQAMSSIPGVGQYGPLAGLLATLGFGVYQALQRKKLVDAAAVEVNAANANLENVVKSVEVAFPTKPPDVKATLAKVQGEATSLTVDEIKKRLGL